jgi:SOS-response transcriptional repressor LexA
MWEVEANDIPTPTLERLAEKLQTSPAYLLGWSDDPIDYSADDLSDVSPEIIEYFGGDARRIREFLRIRDDEARAESFSVRIPSNISSVSDLHHQRVPMLGSVAAGQPIYDEEVGVYVDSPVDCDAALTVRGDSMEPTYLDGDVVYIKCMTDVPEGAVAVVFLDDEATLKHIYKRPTGLTLWSDNTTYPPMNIEFEDYANVRVFGVPVGYTRMYKKGIEGKIKKGMK